MKFNLENGACCARHECKNIGQSVCQLIPKKGSFMECSSFKPSKKQRTHLLDYIIIVIIIAIVLLIWKVLTFRIFP